MGVLDCGSGQNQPSLRLTPNKKAGYSAPCSHLLAAWSTHTRADFGDPAVSSFVPASGICLHWRHN